MCNFDNPEIYSIIPYQDTSRHLQTLETIHSTKTFNIVNPEVKDLSVKDKMLTESRDIGDAAVEQEYGLAFG